MKRPQLEDPPPPPLDPTTQYAQDVVDGKIIAGPPVRDACRRHLRDLEEGPKRGFMFDREEAQINFDFFEEILRLNGGEFENTPFVLQDSQKFIVGCLFGWKTLEGVRRFRQAYIEEGKGNGKSPLVAGIGIKMLVADQEPRAEVYAAATKRDQAQVLFRDAVAMVDLSPELDRTLKRTGGKGHEWNIAHEESGSFFRTLASDDSQSGPRPHCGLLDEVHEHKSSLMVDMMRLGTKGRRQPLILMITNSGSDKQSVCWRYHDYAIKVCSGMLEDDTFFSYVCSLDGDRDVTLSVDEAFTKLIEPCNFDTENAKTIQINGHAHCEGFASFVTSKINKKEITRKDLDALDIRIDQLVREVCATTVTSNGLPQSIRSTSNSALTKEEDGNKKISKQGLNTGTSGLQTDQDTDKQKILSNDSENSESAKNLLINSLKISEGSVQSVTNKNLSHLITATLQELLGGLSVGSVMVESACSEILSKLYNAHSTTCRIHQTCKLEKRGLVQHLLADDPFEDESCWIKVNPLLGVSIKKEYLREQVREAKGMPSKASRVRRLNFCQWVDSANPWLPDHIWLAARDTDFDEDKLRNRTAYGGLDLSSTLALTAFVLEFEPTEYDPYWRQKAWFWLPSESVDRIEKDYQLDYLRAWIASGFINVTKGSAVNKLTVLAKIVSICAQYNVRAIGYDRWRIEDLKMLMNEEGVKLPLIEFGQGYKDMSPAVEAYETKISNGQIKHDGNPVLSWNVSSVVIESDPANNRKLTKAGSTGLIDGAVAMVMAEGIIGKAPPPVRHQFFSLGKN